MRLFQPEWMSGDYCKAERAIQRVKSQTVLCHAAREAPDMRIRKEAIERMEDASMLMELARDTGPEGIGEQAVDRLLEIEPFASAWCDICMTNGRATIHNTLLQDCLAYVSRYGTVILRRKAAGFVTDQALLKWIYENDKDEAARVNALVRIDDQDYLQAVFEAADSEDLRLCIAIYMQNPASAAWMARNTEKPYTCIKALRKTGDKALGAEIMGQTLHLAVCEECAGMVNAADITDDWRLAVLALCGPEEVRADAVCRIQDFTVFERIAACKHSQRFPVKHEWENIGVKAAEYGLSHETIPAFQSPEFLRAVALNPNMPNKLSVQAVSRIADERILLALAKGANAREVREEALRRITDVEILYTVVRADMPRSFTPEICTRLDELDADWPLRLDDDVVKALVKTVSCNRADERFDMRYIGSVLKRVYQRGRIQTEIKGLMNKPIAHSDHHGKEYRSASCHNDEGYTYFTLD